MYPLVKKIIIADDHPLIRRGLKMLINNELNLYDVTEVDNFHDLLRQLSVTDYSHLILDLTLADVNSAEKFSLLHKQYPAVAILIYSMHPMEVYGPHLIKLGARGYLNKQSTDDEVINCLKAFFTGKKCKGEMIYEKDTPKQEVESDQNPFSSLSQRELDVLPYLLNGNSIKEIASALQLKPNTVATFKTRILEKLKVKNVFELNKLASLYQFSFS
jgi:two-component system, NarL family, invasion response regulator UvrY